MATPITDSELEQRVKAQRHASGGDRYDEVWDGVCVMSPQPNIEHQRMVTRLVVVLCEVIGPPPGGDVFPGVNLSDRAEGWEDNYRAPDVAAFLSGSRAQAFESHFLGPADFLIEIISPSDKTREKIDFYSRLGARELLIIDRYPWSLELYRHDSHELVLAGRSSLEISEIVASAILPLSFQLLAAGPRPQIRITEIGGQRQWSV
jgi:Uma2 family endonuclease